MTVRSRVTGPVVFVAVGVSALLIDLVVLVTLREVFDAPLALAAASGQVVGLGWNYAFQRRVTFGSGIRLRQGLPRYLAMVGLNYLVTVALVTLGEETGVGYLTGKAVAVAVLTPTNFYAYRAWVFPRQSRSS